ncbi:MAG: hypothetical protein HYS08_07340 [Chlamydiae bacterium]|nr:hypothetical protein [Chlamydiota bacterium]MBI3266309.1 hypothetical protein [Chlamydiota bacterium]
MREVHSHQHAWKNFFQNTAYSVEAYEFVLDTLDFALRKLDKPRHLTAQELLERLREYALKIYGPMAKTLLENWGVKNCQDFGEIVFGLVQYGIISKQDSDSKEDFKVGYDFEEAFQKPFNV